MIHLQVAYQLAERTDAIEEGGGAGEKTIELSQVSLCPLLHNLQLA
jgi:hypothetical protein